MIDSKKSLLTWAERLVNARKEPQNWATYFGAYDAWRYSSLDQIRVDNVKNLVSVWAFQTGKVEGGLNATPIVVDGIMYLIASEDRVFALNAETGERLWTYNYKFSRDLISPIVPKKTSSIAAWQSGMDWFSSARWTIT